MATLRPAVLQPNAIRAWPVAIALCVGWFVWLMVWYFDTVASMVATWNRSQTFAHGFVVFPIAAWLVFRMRRELQSATPCPSLSPFPLLLMLASAGLWLAGDLADVLPARQLAWITMLIAGVWLVVGDAIARLLMFPLAFLYFAVPIGEFMMPTLISWTADFVVVGLRASGVPVVREGMRLEIPTGTWSVVEACSGLRYMIASAMVGALFAYLTYRSFARRAAFVFASLLVPIVANWFRAYLIVMIGHLSGNRLAVGVDHLIYGWVFFGVVIALLFWVGSFWREDIGSDDSQRARTPITPRDSPDVPRARRVMIPAAFLVAAAAPVTVGLLHTYDLQGPVQASAPPLSDWRPEAGTMYKWVPQFLPPRATIASTYRRADERAGLHVALYYNQDAHSKLVSSENQLLHTSDAAGHVIAQRSRTIDVANRPFEVQESILRLAEGRVLVRSWYWVGGTSTASRVAAKLAQARSRLMGRGDSGAIIVVYASLPDEGDTAPAGFDDLTRKAAGALPDILAQRLRAGDPS